MDQYLLIPFLVGWTSIYQLFWCSPGVQGFDTLPFMISSALFCWVSTAGARSCADLAQSLLDASSSRRRTAEAGEEQGTLKAGEVARKS